MVRDEALTTSWDYEDNEAELGAEPDIRLHAPRTWCRPRWVAGSSTTWTATT